MERKIFVFFGAPASGKGTRIEILRDRGFTTISTSQLLKNSGFDLSGGNLISDDVVIELVSEAISKTQGNIILDGFPRTVPQALSLIENGIHIDKVINIDAPTELLVERACNRLTCPECGEIFTKTDFKPPKVKGICDNCGSHLIVRDDDKEEIAKKRISIFYEKTLPVLDEFRKLGTPIITLDATLPPKEGLDLL